MNAVQQQERMLQQKMQQKIDAMMINTKYPASMVPAAFEGVLRAALQHESQQTLGCNWTILKSIRNEDPAAFNLAQMGHALNAVQSKTPDQLRQTGMQYDAIMDMQEQMAVRWNEIVAPLTDEIKESISSQKKQLFIPSKKIHKA
jgi:hypothetical protein